MTQRYCIWKQWKKPNRRMRAFRQLGIEAGMAYAWSRSRMGGWAIAQSPIMGVTVTEERLAKRGYQSFLKYYERLFQWPDRAIFSVRRWWVSVLNEARNREHSRSYETCFVTK